MMPGLSVFNGREEPGPLQTGTVSLSVIKWMLPPENG